MMMRFKCEQGHEWEALSDVTTVVTCPRCGSAPEVTGSWAGQPPATPSARDDRTLRSNAMLAPSGRPTVSGYEILSMLGRGGMGVVYKARQVTLNRIVALKMLMAGAHAPADIHARFRSEAETIAALQHPNIVQIYEVGQVDGQPYLALEFVDGGSLADLLRGRPQPPRQAAELVHTLARAVHAAHQQNVIHRDLKPANVLLSADGTPKVTDFGLARRLETTDRLTPTGDVLGTPNYMAPEQASGAVRNVGPVADVYALGAILYEMLVGRPPFLAENPVETVLQVLRDEPVPPRQLLPTVPRDLETICLKCLQKSARKRYASAEELAQDLKRYLSGEPIVARPTGRVERLIKWAKRKPAVAALAAVCIFAVVLVLGISLRSNALLQSSAQRERVARIHAESSFQKARQAVKELAQVGREELANAPHADPIRKTLLERASRLHKDLLEQSSDDPSVRLEAGQAAYDLGDIYEMLNEFAAARQHFERAIDIFTELSKKYPHVAEYERELAHSLIQLGSMLAVTNASAEAEQMLRQAVAILQEIPIYHPVVRLEQARAWTNLGPILNETNRGPAAEQILREGEKLLVELVSTFPTDRVYREKLAACRVNLGVVLNRSGKDGDAVRVWFEALEGYKHLAEVHPSQRSYQRQLAVTCRNLGSRLSSAGAKHQKTAETFYSLALDYHAPLVRDFPQVPQYRHDEAVALEGLGLVLYVNGQIDKGEKALQDSLKIKTKLVEEYPRVGEFRGSLGLTLQNIARQAVKRGAWSDARRYFDDAIREQTEAATLEPSLVPYRRQLADTHWFVADMLIGLKDHAGAAKEAENVISSFPESGEYAHYAARLFSRCIPLVEKGDRLTPTERSMVIKDYTERAINAVRQALKKGFKEIDREEAMKDFHSLRESAEFRKLISGR